MNGLKLPVRQRHADIDSTLRHAVGFDARGTIVSIHSSIVHVKGLRAAIGACCEIKGQAGNCRGRVIGHQGEEMLVCPSQGTLGIRAGDCVRLLSQRFLIPVGSDFLGRIVDCDARPIDHLGTIAAERRIAVDDPAPDATQRPPIQNVLETGVKAIDVFTSIGRGQRMGLFAGAGVGKSKLLGMIARGTDADVVVVGLIGERGREVSELLQQELDEETRRKCVTVVATSDQSPMQRVQAAMSATTLAEHFRDQGKHVLLLMDSITRFALAQRELGLAAGEVPTTRGFPPSVFSELPKLVERAGTNTGAAGMQSGSITGIYTVLLEADDPQEPIGDSMQSLLDGHIHLSRTIAQAGRYPAIDIPASLSRLQNKLLSGEDLAVVNSARRLLASYGQHEDLIRIGGYEEGSDPLLDQAIAVWPALQQFLAQPIAERTSLKSALNSLRNLLPG